LSSMNEAVFGIASPGASQAAPGGDATRPGKPVN
jgi:hypothetical protein